MSTLPPECQQLLVSGYVLGNLSPAEALLFEEMVRENPDLIEQVNLMQQALDEIYTPTEVVPPPALRDRILTTANDRQADLKTSDLSVNTEADNEAAASPKFKIPGNKILGAIALAIITVLGITNYRLWQNVQTAKTTDTQNIKNTQGNRASYLLQNEDIAPGSTAKLVVNPNGLNATLRVDNLPPLPQDRVYALWTVVGKDVPYTTDEKGAILTAVFQVDESGNFARKIAVPQPHLEPKTIDKMAITVEDISAPQAHQGSIFISTGN